MHARLPSARELSVLLSSARRERWPNDVQQKLRWFLHFREVESVSVVCAEFGIARTTFYRWLRRFDPRDLRSLLDRPTATPLRRCSLPHVCSQGHVGASSVVRWRVYAIVIVLTIVSNLTFFFFFPFQARAASAVLVNTESFHIIDEGDETSDIEVRFGDMLNERLYFDRSDATFRVSDDLYVDDALEVVNTMSGRSLRIAEDAIFSSGTIMFSETGAVVFNEVGNNVDFRVESESLPTMFAMDASENRIGVGTDPEARFHIKGGGAGQKFRYETRQSDYSLRIGGGFSGTKDEVALTAGARVETHEADTASAAWAINFSGLSDYFSFARGANNGTGAAVTWTEHLRMDEAGDVSIGLGSVDAETKLEVGGTLSGASTITFSSLKSCDTIDTNASGVLSCGTDDGGAGGGAPDTATFSDATDDTGVSWTSETDLWDGSQPNITTDAAANCILILVDAQEQTDDAADAQPAIHIESATDPTAADCTTGQVGSDFWSGFRTTSGQEDGIHGHALYCPGAAATYNFTVCSGTSGLDDGNILDLQMTLIELGG